MECKGCEIGVKMCHHRPCQGTPEEFEKIINAGYIDKLKIDVWYGHHDSNVTLEQIENEKNPKLKYLLELTYKLQQHMGENPFRDNVEFLCGKTHKDNSSNSIFDPIGTCQFLTKDNLCFLHDKGLKPEQGRESCCKTDVNVAKDNLHYAKLWNTEKGKQVITKFKMLMSI